VQAAVAGSKELAAQLAAPGGQHSQVQVALACAGEQRQRQAVPVYRWVYRPLPSPLGF
jgi:hypothetical protein